MTVLNDKLSPEELASRMSYLDTKILMPELPTTSSSAWVQNASRNHFRQRLALLCGHRIARTSTEIFTGSSSAPPPIAPANAILGQGKMPVSDD
jgi:hypothetical protein